MSAIDVLYIMFSILALWHGIGYIIIGLIERGAHSKATGFEFVNPCFIYKHVKVNWFGTVVLTLCYTVLLPIPAICYWFYKLCTIGRKA